MEDIITLLDGRPELAEEVREARDFISRTFREFLGNRDFVDSLPGHLMPDPASQKRIPLLMERIREIAKVT